MARVLLVSSPYRHGGLQRALLALVVVATTYMCEMLSTADAAVTYPPGTIFYVRERPPPVKQAFFSRFWIIGVFLICIVVVALYIILCTWICCHFEYSKQKEAKKVVQKEYEANGFFDVTPYVKDDPNAPSSHGSQYDANPTAVQMQRRGSEMRYGQSNQQQQHLLCEDDVESIGDDGSGESSTPDRQSRQSRQSRSSQSSRGGGGGSRRGNPLGPR